MTVSVRFWLSPAQRRRRAISTGVAIILVVITCILFVIWWRHWDVQRTRLKTLLERRDQVESILANRVQLNTALVDAQATLTRAPIFWSDSGRSQAQAAMSKRLQGMIDVVGDGGRRCRLENLTPISDSESTDSARPVTVTVRMLCGNSEWLQLARALEASKPYMFVENLAIQSSLGNTSSFQNVMASNALQIQMDVYGYMSEESLLVSRP